MNLLSNGIASAAGAVGGLVAGPGNATANALNGASAASAIQQYNQAANVGTIDDTPAINPLSIPEAGVALVGAAVLIAAEELYNGLGDSHDPGAASVPSQTASSDNGQGSGSVNFQVVSPENPWKEAYIPPSERFEIPGFSISDSKEFPTSEIFDLPLLEFLNSGLGYGAVHMTASGGAGKQSSLPSWRASEKDFVGEQGSKNKEGLRIMPASEDSKAAAYKFLDDITKWLAQDGIEEVSNQKRPTAKAGGTRHEIIFSDGTTVNIRDGESAGNKTDDDTYTLEVNGHADVAKIKGKGNMKINFRQIKK
ncbi:hypothetical protein J3T99_05170 [Acetobacteraceae bacterium B3987]|nr:hypothetical protein [Acetobacteraceae bacterium B3987]